MLPTLSIIIVNWNAGEQLKNCLQSIQNCNQSVVVLKSVIVVDNASTDCSLDGLKDLKIPLQILKNSQNLGFGKACNQGVKEAGETDYLLFFNPDACLFENSLEKAIEFMETPENAKVGITGLQLLDEEGKISRTCARFPTPALFFIEMTGLDYLVPNYFHSRHMKEWPHETSKVVDHVIGAFYLVRSNLFLQLKGFDEDYYVYLEDLDFSFRAKKTGWASYYLADVQAYHKGGGTSDKVKAKRLFYSLRSRIQYGYKHFGFGMGTILAIATLALEPISRLTLSLLKGSLSQAIETTQAFYYLWLSIPSWFPRIQND